ncbi:MAG: hypothetical protein HQL39_05845 [Alphaproteobacteria bacterium]|nr:hypothetical protein [Alphaproteobacteria bacterium]
MPQDVIAAARHHLNNGRLPEAADLLAQAVAERPGEAGLRAALTQVLRGLSRAEPGRPQIHRRLADALADLGDATAARDAYHAALLADPDDLAARWLGGRVLPRVYHSPEDIDLWRGRFVDAIGALAATTPLDGPEQAVRAANAILLRTNFELAYQARDDRPAQELWGRLTTRSMAGVLPDLAAAPPRPERPDGRIRIGYASSFFWSHTISLLFAGWIMGANRDRFAVHVYLTGGRRDGTTETLGRHADVFRDLHATDVAGAARAIRDDRLDVLVFPDLGMEPRSFALAALKLAPVVCVGMGHPVTTGLPTVDWFLTSDLMEPEGGEAHYAEKLLRLPGTSFHYTPNAKPPAKGRAALGLPEDGVLYLCCQAQQKYLPQYDALFPAIAARLPASRFVFIEHRSMAHVNRMLRARIERAFAARGLDPSRHLVFLPWLEWTDFLDLNAACDVFLDSVGWSGGNTTFEALSRGMPVVTLPGAFMRGRHALAMLRILGAEDCVARDADHYVEIAVRLGEDRGFHERQRAIVAAGRDRLFRDRAPVEALEVFYQRVAG